MKKPKTLKQAKARLNWLWKNGFQKGIRANDEKIAIVGARNYSFMDGSFKYVGTINFDRWYDSDVFHKAVGGMYVPNEIGEKVEATTRTIGGGSAWLNFNSEHIDLVKKTLEDFGYTVFLDIEPKNENTLFNALPTNIAY